MIKFNVKKMKFILILYNFDLFYGESSSQIIIFFYFKFF